MSQKAITVGTVESPVSIDVNFGHAQDNFDELYLAQKGTNVKLHGAVGDGTTDDTTAIEAALTAALSANKILYFPAGTYLIKRSIVIQSRVRVIGVNAKITKAPAVTQLIQQNVLLGATTVSVVDASVYEVGQDFYMHNETGFPLTGVSPYSATVGRITGLDTDANTVTFTAYRSTGAKAAISTSAASMFSTAFPLISTNGTLNDSDDIVIEGLTLDPNPQVGDPTGYVLAVIHIDPQQNGGAQKNVVVRNNIILRSASDGISVQAEKNVLIENNKIYDVACKGIHIGTTITNVTIRNNIIERCALDCGIYWCYGLSKIIVTNNFIKDCKIGMDGISADDIDSVIAFNTFDNCTNYAINIGSSTRCLIYGNVFSNINVTANYAVVTVDTTTWISISGNTFAGFNAASAGRCIHVGRSSHVMICDNLIKSFIGNYAIDIDGSPTPNEYISIRGNIVSGGLPIYINNSNKVTVSENILIPSLTTPISISGTCSDVVLSDNRYTGIVINAGTRTKINGVTGENTGGAAPNREYYDAGGVVEDTSTKDIYILSNNRLAWAKMTSTIIDALTYSYKDGDPDLMVAGQNTGASNTSSKESDHLLMTAVDNNTTIDFVTDAAVDLTGVNKIIVEWLNSGAASNYVYSYFGVSATKEGAWVASTYIRQGFTRRITELDVSAVTGLHYLKVMARDGGADSILSVYKLGYK